MPVYLLGDDPIFPPVDGAEEGLVAVGGDLSVERLVVAYRNGLFPWYDEEAPILWHSPDPRWLVLPDSFRVPKRLQRTLKQQPFRVTRDQAFREVVTRCAEAPRPDQEGTWIHPEMIDAYVALHDAGWAHSVEAWSGERLVGGFYGVQVGSMFCGESMFADEPDASKVAFAEIAQRLFEAGATAIDCQTHTDHLERFGAVARPRRTFLVMLFKAREQAIDAW